MAICGRCHRDVADGSLFCSFCGESIKPVTHPGEVVDPLIGQTVAGKYFIHQLLGRGGMGDVYKATHLTLDRPVVLKLLKKLFHSDASLVQRFHREARAASRLNHPNSITIIDFGQTDDGTLFMAMEYLAGRSLERVIADEGSIQEVRSVHIGAQILAALAEAHALGIIHRDLKPANVMIETRRDEPDFVKVLDFGIAKLNEPGQGQGLTQAGLVCGTPGYMSTEQVRGDELDARSDIYAVGVILYEMLTGVLPFESDTPMGLVTKHLVEDPPPLAVRKPGTVVSPTFEGIVMRALARDRRDRFSSADDMRAALLACGSSAPPMRPTPLPSSTMVFDAGALPQAARMQPTTGTGARGPVTGSSKIPRTPGAGVPIESTAEVQSRMTAELPQTSPRIAPPPAAAPPPLVTPTPLGTARPPGVDTATRPTSAAPEQTAARSKTPPASTKKSPAPHPAAAPPRHPSVEEQHRPPAARRGNKVPLLVAGAAVGVLVIAVVVWGVTRGSSKPQDSTATAAAPAAPRGQDAAPPAEPHAPAPQPPAPQPIQPAASSAEARSGSSETPKPEPPLAPQPEIAKEPVEPQHARSKAEGKVVAAAQRTTKGIRSIGKELNSIPTPPESSGDGVLTVMATPWALVVVDGRKVGETPRELRLGAGTYHVRASHPALGTREQFVTIKAGKRKVWSPTFAN